MNQGLNALLSSDGIPFDYMLDIFTHCPDGTKVYLTTTNRMVYCTLICSRDFADFYSSPFSALSHKHKSVIITS